MVQKAMNCQNCHNCQIEFWQCPDCQLPQLPPVGVALIVAVDWQSYPALLPKFDLRLFCMAMRKTSVCPHCDRPTTPKELSTFNGVCKFCRQSFQVSHGGWLRGPRAKTLETPFAFKDVVWADGELQQITDFDFDQVDELLGEIRRSPADSKQVAAELFGKIMAWCWSGNGLSFRKATIRFTTLTAALKPELVAALSYEQIGRRLNLTKAAISKTAKLFERAFNFTSYRGRSEEQCARFSKIQTGHAPTNCKTPHKVLSRKDSFGLTAPQRSCRRAAISHA
jgi:hypothetical protein